MYKYISHDFLLLNDSGNFDYVHISHNLGLVFIS